MILKSTVSLFTLSLMTVTVSGEELLKPAEKSNEKTFRTLYVSPEGNDKSRGTQKAPFATIARAASLAKPGDTVKIGPGIYREQVTFTRSGKQEAPITFLGSRGKNGEYLTIMEAPGADMENWVPAPEIAPKVWKTPLQDRPELVLMDGKMIALIFQKRMELPRWEKLPKKITWPMIGSPWGPNCKRLPGFDLMSMPKDLKMGARLLGKTTQVDFWPVIGNVIAGWSKGYLYVRFANGDEPKNHRFTASRGNGFILKNASHLVFKDLHLRGSRIQFHLRGKSSHNTIDSCLLMHGGNRVRIDEKVTHTTVKNSVLTAGFIRNDLFGLRAHTDMRGGLLYIIFKYFIGSSVSDDSGIRDSGSNTQIIGNIILQGLVGIDAYGVNCEIRDNVVREMSSVGICTNATTVGIFTGNLVMNCGIPLRIHDLRAKRAKREEYHFGNLFVQARHDGSQTHVHSQSYLEGPDMVNFEKGTKIYKQNPPAPVDAGKFYIYHNTFWGGYDKGWICAFKVREYSERFRMVMPFYVVNNIYKDNPILGVKTHELAGPNLLYVFDEKVSAMRRLEPEVVKFNKVLDIKASQKIWNKNDLPGLPDLTLAPDSPALEAGIDISKPFTANGKQYPALPGFKPGYFKGKAPAAGAFQAGESMDRFIEMHRKAEKISQMLKKGTSQP